MAILSNSELFWNHTEICKICDQHPQSVASFYYERMCLIGRSYAKSYGWFKEELPDITGFDFYIQDSADIK